MLDTRDAIHVATALVWRKRRAPGRVFATHDRQQARAATAPGFDVLGVTGPSRRSTACPRLWASPSEHAGRKGREPRTAATRMAARERAAQIVAAADARGPVLPECACETLRGIVATALAAKRATVSR